MLQGCFVLTEGEKIPNGGLFAVWLRSASLVEAGHVPRVSYSGERTNEIPILQTTTVAGPAPPKKHATLSELSGND